MREWLWHVLNARSLWAHYRICRRYLSRAEAYHAAVYDLRQVQLLSDLPSRRDQPAQW